MTNTHPLQIAPDVAALVPGEALARFRDDPNYEHLTCVCGLPIAAGSPAALLVVRDPVLDLKHLSATHPACQPSGVIEADLSHLAAPSDGHEITLSAGIYQPPGGQLEPRLSVGPVLEVSGSSPAGDLASLILRHVLGHGLDLVTDPHARLGPPTQHGWLVTLTPMQPDGLFAVRVDAPDGSALAQDATLYAAWPQWAQLIRAAGAVNLLVGSFLRTPDAHPTLLEELAAAGRLAGARVPAVVGPAGTQ